MTTDDASDCLPHQVGEVLALEDEREVQMRREFGPEWELLASDGAATITAIRAVLSASEDKVASAARVYADLGSGFAEAAAGELSVKGGGSGGGRRGGEGGAAAGELSASRLPPSSGELSMLEFSMADLVDQLPHAGGSSVAKLPVARTLRAQLDQLEALKTTRDALTLRASSMIGLTRSVRIERDADGLVGMTLVDTPKEEQGVRVASCEADGPAARAGVQVGDTIL